MVYVGDVAKVLVNALEKANMGIIFDRAVEVGDGAKQTVKEIAEIINNLTGNKAGITYLPMRPGEKEGDVVSADPETLHMVDLDKEDLMNLIMGMEETIQYFRATEGVKWHKVSTK